VPKKKSVIQRDKRQRISYPEVRTMDIRQMFGEPYLKFTKSLQDAVTHPELNQHAAEAYGEFMRVLQDTWKEADQKRPKEAYEKYVNAVQEALSPSLVQERSRDAFQAYLQAIHEAWNRVDVNSLDAASLAAIAESMLRVAWLASLNSGDQSSGDAPPSPSR
jgi:hypothetical protein